MTKSFCLMMGQINPIVGDVAGNVQQILNAVQQAKKTHHADLIVFPELTLTGYPPEDLLLRPGLIKRVEKGLIELKKQISSTAIIIGHPTGEIGQGLYNAASLIADGRCVATYYKHNLPNYSVFDEKRYFIEGQDPCVVEYKGIHIGITICEDIWYTEPVAKAVEAGAELIVNLNASPFCQGKWQQRVTEVQQRVREAGVPIVYVNQIGGQDELVFDGGSFVIDVNGEQVASAPMWQAGLYPLNLERTGNTKPLTLTGTISSVPDELALIYQALICGLRDYVTKNGFKQVVIGLSGGIDSALTLALAVDALGAERVKTVMMPSQYTAEISLTDAQQMANGLGVEHSVIAIDSLFQQFNNTLAEQFSGKAVDITEENIQARIRGVIIMAISNKTGAMVLSTGNKSEMAVGYSTLYGDMAGGFSPLKDVYKTLVYRLANYRNSLSSVIPERIITRPPSAELAPDQLDQDSLPNYDILDDILERYIAQDWCFEDLVANGSDADTVAKVIRMIDRNEYKRRQAPPGIRITQRAFGRDRRYPITSRYTVTSNIE